MVKLLLPLVRAGHRSPERFHRCWQKRFIDVAETVGPVVTEQMMREGR
jgi:hypothetical protein